MATIERRTRNPAGVIATLNGRWHKAALMVFSLVVVAHWTEHIVQAYQIWVLDWPRPKAGGLLGKVFPVLVSSEWLHYGFAVVMLIAFITLRSGFTGRSRKWWDAAMWIQVWHHFEHFLLLMQALTGAYLFGQTKPTSILQTVFPRVELHLFYNAVVTIPMVVAMVLHLRPGPADRELMRCSCATTSAT